MTRPWSAGWFARAQRVAVLVVVMAGAGCGDDAPPMAPSGGNPPPAPSLVSLTFGANTFNLTAIGETQQLTVTARYSDNTTRDVTSEASWFVSDTRVLRLSPTGLLTVLQFGRSSVSASFSNRSASANVTATPPGTFVIYGRVREPGQSGLRDALVADPQSGLSTTSDIDGEFSIGEMPQEVHLSVTKAGYESRIVDASSDGFVDIPVQRVVRIAAGGSATPLPIAPNDLEYIVDGVRCSPCRMMRIDMPAAGALEIRVTWQQNVHTLSLFGEGLTVSGTSGLVSGVITVGSARETVVFFGVTSATSSFQYTNFTIETTLR